VEEHRLIIGALVIAGVVVLARALSARLKLPDAILLVLLGIGTGFLPGMPHVEVPADVVLFGFLPPLIYNAAFFSSPREVRTVAVPIITLAFGLTAVTSVAIAATAEALLPGLGWAAALAFGAAVAPTDAVAATSVLQRMGAAPQLVTVLESESLINDGVALTIFGLATEAMTTPFTFGHGVLRALQVVLGGIGYGAVLAYVARRVRRRVRDPSSQIVLTLAVPYLAYLPAESVGASGVLATVTVGFVLGIRPEGQLQPAVRLTGQMFWKVLVFLLESALFVLLGLQIHTLVDATHGRSWTAIVAAAAAVVGVAVAVRVGWEMWVSPLIRKLPGRHRGAPGPDLPERLVLGLSGLRGAISLAIALSLPTGAGADRPVLILLAAIVVVATLVGQAPLLPVLLRRFGMVQTDRQRQEVMTARKAISEAALAHIDELAEDDRLDERTAHALRQPLELRLDRLRAWLDEDSSADDVPDTRSLEKLQALYRKGRINDATFRTVGQELTIQAAGLQRHGLV
jgi:CPA1 family monovalent cation:H+ antiporter